MSLFWFCKKKLYEAFENRGQNFDPQLLPLNWREMIFFVKHLDAEPEIKSIGHFKG